MPNLGKAPGNSGENVAWFVKFSFEAVEPGCSAAMHKFPSHRYAFYLRNERDEEAFILKYEGAALFYTFSRRATNSDLYDYLVIADDVPLPEKEGDVEWLRPLDLTANQIKQYVKVAKAIPLVIACKMQVLPLLSKLEYGG